MMQSVVHTDPFQPRSPHYNFDFGSGLMEQRAALQGALPSSNYDNALPFETA
jgi:hypothetical protein